MGKNRSEPTEPEIDSAAPPQSGSMQRPLLVYLQAILPSLNPTERQIGEYILEDPERVLSSSISDMRRGSGASVVRPQMKYGPKPGLSASSASR